MSIQKYKPQFESGGINKQSVPFTQLCNKTIQNCTNMEAIGMWAYLQSMPDEWELNPNQLKKHFNVGKNKIYRILTYMIEAKLIVRHVHVCAKGTRVKTTYTVLNGMEFLEPSRPVQECAPLPQNPEVDNPEVDNRDYIKERDLQKKEKDIKEISLINSASENAQEKSTINFDEFWKIYPVKKNKVRAKKIWDRNKLDKLSAEICFDVTRRVHGCAQWNDIQFIPHPSTYLANKLWNDDLTPSSAEKKQDGDAFSRVFFGEKNIGGTYDEQGNDVNPFN